MDNADYLLTLSEVSATFAGLAAIVTVLRGPQHRPWSPREKVGLWGLVGPSLSSFLLALLPQPFLDLGVSPGVVWTTLSEVVAIGWLAGGWGAIRALRRATSLGFPDPTPFSNAALVAMGVVAMATASLNAIGVFGGPTSAIFALSLLFSLGFSVVIFVTFLYASTAFSKTASRGAAPVEAHADSAEPRSASVDSG